MPQLATIEKDVDMAADHWLPMPESPHASAFGCITASLIASFMWALAVAVVLIIANHQ
jgi:hypothetical protein